jgi:hypothetical protein
LASEAQAAIETALRSMRGEPALRPAAVAVEPLAP